MSLVWQSVVLFDSFVIRMRKGMRIATPVCALARNDILDYTSKNEPGVPKGWKDYYPGEGSHCPWGHPHKFQFTVLLSFLHSISCSSRKRKPLGYNFTSFPEERREKWVTE